jgi:hypothetical protein
MEIVSLLLDAIGLLRNAKKEKRELVNAALTKMSLALRETEFYYQDYQRDGANHDAQRRLAALWADAAIAMRDVNPTLAGVINEKSYYHAVYGDYPKAKAQQLGIDLASVRKKYQEVFDAP